MKSGTDELLREGFEEARCARLGGVEPKRFERLTSGLSKPPEFGVQRGEVEVGAGAPRVEAAGALEMRKSGVEDRPAGRSPGPASRAPRPDRAPAATAICSHRIASRMACCSSASVPKSSADSSQKVLRNRVRHSRQPSDGVVWPARKDERTHEQRPGDVDVVPTVVCGFKMSDGLCGAPGPHQRFSQREPDGGSRAVDRDRLGEEGSRIRRAPGIEKRLRRRGTARPQGDDARLRYCSTNRRASSNEPLLDEPNGLARLLAANPVVETEIRERHQRGHRHGTGWEQERD